MKHYLLLLLACLLSFGLLGQCPEGSVILRTQADMDEFVALFPECASIEGNLFIGNFTPTDIADISGLNGLQTVAGDLIIRRNPDLLSLAGLDSLQYVGGQMSIWDNDALTSLDELEHLLLIEDALIIRHNDNLRSITGIQNLALNSLNELGIFDNPQLSDCAITNICTFLHDCVNLSISGNGNGCQNVLEIRAACGIDNGDHERGQIITFSGGSIRQLQLSDDGTHLFVARLDSGNVFINVFEWNGQEWMDLGRSSSLNKLRTSWEHYHYFLESRFSENGVYYASREVAQTLGFSSLFSLEKLKVYEWQGGNNWSLIERPNEDREEFEFSVSSALNRTAMVHRVNDRSEPYVRVYENGQQLGADIREYAATSVSSLTLSRDGSRLAVNFDRGQNTVRRLRLYEWNGTAWEAMAADDETLSAATFNTFNPAGDHLLCTYEDTQKLYAWNGSAWGLVNVLQYPSTVYAKWFLSADTKRMLANFRFSHWLWDGQSWNEAEMPVAPTCDIDTWRFTVSADFSSLAIGTNATTVVVYSMLPDDGFQYSLQPICVENGPRTFEQAVSPAGGMFSGPGTREGAEAGSFVFDPAVAGIGTHEIRYVVDSDTFRSTIRVVEATPPELNIPDTLRIHLPRLRQIPGMGIPQGGVYADDNGYLIDDDNGQTFSLTELPPVARMTISYTVPDENACTTTVSKEVVLVNESPYGGGLFPNQIGEDVISPDVMGQYGYSVSLSADGKRMAIGDPKKDLGEVYIYDLEGGEWVQKATLLAEFREAGFGAELALSGDGNRLIVCVPEYYIRDIYSPGGYAYTIAFQLYEWDGENWLRSYRFAGWKSISGDIEVDISYDGLVFAAGLASPSSINPIMAFRDSGGGVREIAFTRDVYPWGAVDQQRLALNVDGQRLVVCREAYEDLGTNWISVFEAQDETWVQLGHKIVCPNSGNQTNFSLDISDDGNRIVVGNSQSELPDAPGYVQVYDWNGTDWVQVGTDLVGSTPGEHFGQDVAISGDGIQLIISAPNNDAAGTATGRAALYVWDGNEWQEEEETLFGGDRAYDQFGFSVATSADGATVAIGAIQKDNPLSGGYVRVFAPEIGAMFQNNFPPICGTNDSVTGLSGGYPSGGFYSGPGVIDDGNGQTFTFDPVVAGEGETTITYHLDTLELTNTIFVLPSVPELSLALPDTLVLQSGMPVQIAGSGLPTGGVYRNPGGLLIDNGDGLNLYYDGTISFDTLQTIHYQYTNSEGCTETISTEVVTIVASFQHTMPTICVNADAVSNLSGGYPSGGYYSGPGVSDNGDGYTFTFDPALVGVGETTLTYQWDTLELSNVIEVLPAASPSLNLPDTFFVTTNMPILIPGTGLPIGGVYDAPSGLFIDNGDGLNLYYEGASSFDTLQTINYQYTNREGCPETTSAEVVTIVSCYQHIQPTFCANADVVTDLSGGYRAGGTYSGPGVTDNGDGCSFTFDPLRAGVGEAVITYSLDNLNLTNSIEVLPPPTVTLSLPDTLYVTAGQSEVLAGTGLPIGGVYESPLEFFIDAGDGLNIVYTGEAVENWNQQLFYYTYTDAQGCTQTARAWIVVLDQVVGTDDLPEQVQALHLFPNPTSDQIQVRLHCTEVADLQPQLYDLLGQQLWQSPLIRDRQLTQTLDLTAYPAGTYWLKVRVGEAWLSRRVVKVR